MKKFYSEHRNAILIIGVIAIIGFLIYRSANPSSKVNLTPAILSFVSDSQTVSADAPIKIMVDTKENKVGFVQVKINFDPSKISLKEEPAPSSEFKTIVKNTTVDEANSSGIITLAIGLKPGSEGKSGIFEAGILKFEPKVSNEEVTISYDITGSQIVTMDAKPLPLEKKDLTISPK